LSYSFPGNGNYSGYFTVDVSPADSNLILAGGTNLSRTADGGKTWSEVYSPALPALMIAANYGNVSGYSSYFGRVRFNADGSKVFAALGALGHDLNQRWGAEDDMALRFPTKSIYVGDATAQNFKAINLGSFSGVRIIHPHPTNPDLVYVAFANGEFFVTRNARADTPTFQQLTIPVGYQAVEMDCSPWIDGDLLLVLKSLAAGAPGKVLKAHDNGPGLDLSYSDVALVNANGTPFNAAIIRCAKWNPRVKDQVIVGIQDHATLLVSDDAMKSFHTLAVPASMTHGESAFYLDVQKVAFDRNSDLAVTWSWIGGWYSTDQFKTWNDLLMTYDDSRNLWGNKGVGFAESAVDIFLRPGAAYMSTNDHGLFRSDGVDHTKWQRISRNPGMPLNSPSNPWASLFYPMGVSPDESCILAFARGAYPNNPYSTSQLKLVRSNDKGQSWSNVSSALGLGDPFSLPSAPMKILFNADASQQWILTGKALYFSTDSGTSFKEAVLPLTTSASGFGFSDIAYDAAHGLLYAATNNGLARSANGGSTWTALSTAFVPGVGVTTSGDLVVGFFGKLAVIPYNLIDALAAQNKLTDYSIDQIYVKATVGDTALEASSSQNGFQSIQCQGNIVLAVVRYGDNHGNRTCGSAPLISRDGGTTFQWAMYNMPTTRIFSSAVSDSEILLGCGGGAFRWDMTIPLDPPSL
jgi:hypothetical protein